MQLPPPITSKTNARVKQLRAALSGKASKPGELVGVEGVHLVSEALASGLRAQTVFLRAGSEALLERQELAGVDGACVVVLSREVFDAVAETQTPQGIAALVEIPAARVVKVERTLVLEEVQDPGNVGTLIRSAEAFAFECVRVTPGCANVWSPKVLRASAGSVFRLAVCVGPLAEHLQALRDGGVRTFAAVAREAETVSAFAAKLAAPCAVMIGSEGAGLSEAAIGAADVLVHIPCAIESLNAAVAGSVLMFEAARQNAQRFEAGAL